MSHKFLTTPIYYANAKPHVGAAFTNLLTDTYARFYRLQNIEAYFLTGLDEHGSKVYEKAESFGKNPQEHVDQINEYFLEMENAIAVNPTQRIRTTDVEHKGRVQKIWQKLFEKGDIYKASYEGLYCMGSESFILEKDLDENGNCPGYNVPPKKVSEENYFFKLTKYKDQVREILTSGKVQVFPSFRVKELCNMLDDLEDISFSRPKDSVKWGIPVPNDESQLMYVWCDALCNYVTALGYPDEQADFATFWPASWHFMAKEIIKFHAIFWLAMCLSLEIPLPEKIAAHGHITVDGVKMSKSLGNVIDPIAMVQKYSSDVLRFGLLREMHPGDDFDFSETRLQESYNAELGGKFGNLVSRVLAMNTKYFEGRVQDQFELDFEAEKTHLLNELPALMEKFEVRKAIELWLKFCQTLNQYVEEQKPWALAKAEDPKLAKVMYNLLEGVRVALSVAQIWLPESSDKALAESGLKPHVSLDPSVTLPVGIELLKPSIMFERKDFTEE